MQTGVGMVRAFSPCAMEGPLYMGRWPMLVCCRAVGPL